MILVKGALNIQRPQRIYRTPSFINPSEKKKKKKKIKCGPMPVAIKRVDLEPSGVNPIKITRLTRLSWSGWLG